ncbi:hypothetical protein BGX20_003251 [Mortierella sp. AD010]|nr:hypothetical protein BGX20_003251 [Mortierella sp. AD010]
MAFVDTIVRNHDSILKELRLHLESFESQEVRYLADPAAFAILMEPLPLLEILHFEIQNAEFSDIHLVGSAYMRVMEAVKENDFYVVYDNINITIRHHHQRSNRWNVFDSGITASVILLSSDKNKPAPTLFRPVEERPDADANLFFPNDSDLESKTSAVSVVPVEQLDVVKSAVFPLPVMKLDESTIAGDLSVLQRITEIGLNLLKTWFANPKNTIVAGNQVTVSRLLTLKVHRSFDPDPYRNLSWNREVLEELEENITKLTYLNPMPIDFLLDHPKEQEATYIPTLIDIIEVQQGDEEEEDEIVPTSGP